MTGRMSTATRVRDEIVKVGRSLFERGLTSGSTGNISVRLDDGSILMTPTNASLGDLDPARLALVGEDGTHISGDRPTKEAFLHNCIYCQRPDAHSVVHLHSRNAVAVSMLEGTEPDDVIPPLTAYYVMRVGRLPLVGYYPPGDDRLAMAVNDLAKENRSVLLANHGPVVSGASLAEAQYAIEELEETAALFLMLQGKPVRPLSEKEAQELRLRYGS